jgi:hypothetical protein
MRGMDRPSSPDCPIPGIEVMADTRIGVHSFSDREVSGVHPDTGVAFAHTTVARTPGKAFAGWRPGGGATLFVHDETGNTMSLFSIWRRMTSRRKRRSFYDSQEVMRHAVESMGPIDMRLMADSDLRGILATEGSAPRRMAAEKELAFRAAHRSATSPHAHGPH